MARLMRSRGSTRSNWAVAYESAVIRFSRRSREKLARQFTNHDLKQANDILDRIGYSKRDAQKFRLRPDGQRLFFTIDVIPTLNPDAVDTLELVKRHWVDLGVDLKVNTIERALFFTRGDNNDHDAATWNGPGGLDPMFDARDYLANHPQGSRYALPWATWKVSGKIPF